MSRPNLGPRLVILRKPGWTRAVYYIRWTEDSRSREKSTGECDLAPAEAKFADWLADRRRASKPSTSDPDQIRVVDVLSDYAAEHGPELASPSSLAYAIEPMIMFFAKDTIADLTTERVKKYWVWRREHSARTVDVGGLEILEIIERRIDGDGTAVKAGADDGTIIRELSGALRPAIQHAIEQKRLAHGVYYIPVPQAPRGRDYWITRAQAARLLRETRRDSRARLHLPLYALIALYTGARRGAILDLTWKQIDLVRGVIDFNPLGRRQTKKRRPIIPVPRSLLAALRRAQRRASSDYVIAYRGRKVADVKTGFNSAAERAGIPACTSHTLRHTAGTWMAQRGVPLWEIGGYLGHSLARTTELYAHHHPDYLKTARSAME